MQKMSSEQKHIWMVICHMSFHLLTPFTPCAVSTHTLSLPPGLPFPLHTPAVVFRHCAE